MKSTVYMVISIYNNKKEGLSYEFKVYDNKAKANKKFKENINKFIKENAQIRKITKKYKILQIKIKFYFWILKPQDLQLVTPTFIW